MLFERIRRTQKPVFIFLAFMFGLGFVALGVGQGSGGINIGDLFSSGSSSSSGSISSLSSRVQSHPKDAGAWLQLARAYQADNQSDAAISSYQTYIGLKPKDQNAIAQTAVLFEQRGQATAVKVQQAQAAVNAYTQVQTATAPSSLKLGAALTQPLLTTLATPATTAASTLETSAVTDYAEAMGLRQKLVKLAPTNASYELLLAQDGYATQSYATTATALQAYMKLTPTLTKADKKKLQAEITQFRLLAKSSSSGSSFPGGASPTP